MAERVPAPASGVSARIAVQTAPFDVGVEIARLHADPTHAPGGIGCFVGIVRGGGEPALEALELEHYAGMTEAMLAEIASAAIERFALSDCTLIHRVGRLAPGEPIVLVLAAARHRAAALDANRMLIDWLKTEAPFWKREVFVDGSARWIEPDEADRRAADSWRDARPVG